MKDVVIAFLVGVIVGILTVVIIGFSFFADKIQFSSGSHFKSLVSLTSHVKSILKTHGTSTGTHRFYLNFEKAKDLNFFQLTDGLYAEISSERSTTGAHSLYLEFPKGAKFPGLLWEVFNSNKELNFKGYDIFGFDIYNNNLFNVVINIKLKSGANYPKKVFERQFLLPPRKWTKIRIPISNISNKIDITQISYIKLFVVSPKSTTELFIDNFGVFTSKHASLSDFFVTTAWAEEIPPFKIGLIDSLHKVIPKRRYITQDINLKQDIFIKMAKNETESFQIVFYDIRNDLTLLPDLKIQSSEPLTYKFFTVHFVKTRRPYYPVVYVGLWPDPIIPLDKGGSISLKRGKIYVLWVDLYAPASVKTGQYTAKFLVKDKNGNTVASLPVKIKVWGFSLPNTPSLNTAFDVYDQFFERFFHRRKGEDYALWRARLEKIKFKLYHLMLRYKMSPMLKIDPTKEGSQEIISNLMREGLTCFAIGNKYGGSFGNNWPKDANKLNSVMSLYQDYANVLRKMGLLKRAYIYAWDEGKIGNPQVAKICELVHKADPGLRNMVCFHGFWDPDALPNWGKDINIWCFQISSYNRLLMRKLQNRGMDIWMYVSGPDGQTPNLVIDSMAIEHRILAWMIFSKKISGFLYWAVNFWQCRNPWEDTFNTPWQQNGNGLLFYPYKDKIVPTIRDAIFRDGVEDYEYLKMISAIPDKKLSIKQIQLRDHLLDMDILCPSFTRYTHDADQLLKRRDEIGNFLDEYFKEGHNSN